MSKSRRMVLAAIAVLLVALLAWAWADGGREPLREIAELVPVPEGAK